VRIVGLGTQADDGLRIRIAWVVAVDHSDHLL
jgi:hypothetical protein